MKETRDASRVPKGVLDFSSGSEEDENDQGISRKTLKPSDMDGIRGGNVASGPGRMSLLQHGFSKLFERVKGTPEFRDRESSSWAEESEEDAKDQKREGTSSGICNTGKLGTDTWDNSSSSDREDCENGEKGRQQGASVVKQSNVRKRQDLEGLTDKATTEEVSDKHSLPDKNKPTKLKWTPSKVHNFEVYSDESEDLDVEMIKKPKRNALESHSKERDKEELRERVNHNIKRRSANVRNKTRSKYSEDIEAFPSSEDEYIPCKNGRSTRCLSASPRTESSGVELSQHGQSTTSLKRRVRTSKVVSFTRLKGDTPPSAKGKDVSIDSVLGQAQSYMKMILNLISPLILYISLCRWCTRGDVYSL